jgi:signal transduction histidine kinase
MATAPEGGALVVVELPIQAPDGVTIHEAPARASSSPAAEEVALVTPADVASLAAPDAPLVLVVEDNPDMARFIAGVFAKDYRVAIAVDGQEGVDKARVSKPDLIVTDVMLPKLSGDELVRALRGHRDLDATPILVLTAKADDELRVRLLGQGAQDYLAKPFGAEELLARAKNLIAVKRVRELLEAELATKSGDLEGLARELVRKRRELEAALHAKTAFLSLVSHELTTPLQSMRLNLEALARTPEVSSPVQAERIARIGRASSRLTELIESLLEFVRLESGRLQVHREDVSLRDIAAGVLEDLGAHARQKALELRLVTDDAMSPARTDPKIVRLILGNLVANAIKYTDAGSIEVRVEYEGGTHTIRVIDTGHGIPEDKHSVIFEPFTQLEPLLKKHLPGVGLGLALVRELVKALDGRIAVDSSVGRGTTFTVALPGT